MRPLTRLAALVAFAVLTACASSAPKTTAGGDRNTLTDKDLVASNQGNLFDAVRTLRPNWINRPGVTSRGNANSSGVVVYVDNQRMGELDVLRRMSVNSAATVRWLSPSEAQSKFGLDNAYGVIQVISPGRPK